MELVVERTRPKWRPTDVVEQNIYGFEETSVLIVDVQDKVKGKNKIRIADSESMWV